MPHSPLISKIRCHHPNKQKSRVCNRNYLVYIATREGVDLSDIDYLKIEQQMENLNDNNVSIESANELYAKYIAERPGSHGLFGNFDIENVNTVANQLADLTASGKTIYRGIVSLSEQDAKDLGYIGDSAKDKWVQFMRASIPDVAKQFNIPIDKLKWTAAVHMEKNHPHCHYMFWHDGEVVTNPYIHASVQNACREILSKEMFKEEREQELINKTLYRDLLVDTGRKYLEQETSSILNRIIPKNKSHIMGRISNDSLEKCGQKLLQLSAQLPESGRLNYKLLPPDVKTKVDDFVSELLQEKELQKEYLGYLQTVDNISRTYSASEKHLMTNRKIADEDMRKRLANTVLKSCRKLTRDVHIFDKYIDRADYLSSTENANVINPTVEVPTISDDIITSYDDLSFIYEWNDEYKKALKYIYDQKTRNIPEAVFLLNKQAEQNNILACMELGKLYFNEIVPDVNSTDSIEIGQQYYQKAFAGLISLESADPKSTYEYKLGKLFEKGYGIPADDTKAKYYYELAAHAGNKYAQYSLGSMYLNEKIAPFTEETRQDLIKSGLEYIKKSANSGFPYAAYSYAKTMENESFLNPSSEELNHYYTIAFDGFEKMLSERRDDNLLYRVGTMHYDGKGTPADQDLAYVYFKEAADLNNPNAQYALGKTYSDKKTKYYNISEAIKYFDLAAQKDNIYAMSALGDIYSDSSLEYYDIHKAIGYYDKSLEKGNSLAAYKLGTIYADRDGDFYNLNKAVQNFLIAAKKDNDFAHYKLGLIYLDQDAPNTMYYDPSIGLNYLNKSMDLGNVYAQAKLGNLYLWGKHPAVEKDVEKGLALLQAAAENGNEYAQTSLDIYHNMQGTNIFMKAGYSCFRSAFSTLSQHRRSPDPYTDPAIRNIGKAARKALATRQGRYVDRETKD